MTQIETPRLILRPWRETDSPTLHAFARDPEVGPRAGWASHGSAAESLEVIRTVFAAPEHYAIVPKRRAGGLPVGAVGLMIGTSSQLATSGTEAEIGYWIGRPFWGRGYMPEAVGASSTTRSATCGSTPSGAATTRATNRAAAFRRRWGSLPIMSATTPLPAPSTA